MSRFKVHDVFVSAAQFALLRGVSETYVHRLRRDGRLVSDSHGRVAVLASNALIESTNKRAPSPARAEVDSAEQDRSRRIAALRRNVSTTLLASADLIAAASDACADPIAGRACIAQELQHAADKVGELIYPRAGREAPGCADASPSQLAFPEPAAACGSDPTTRQPVPQEIAS